MRTASRASMVWLGAAGLGLGLGLLALLQPMARAPVWQPPSPSPASPRHLSSSGARPGSDAETLSPAQEQALRPLVAELCSRSANPRDRPASASLESRLTELFSARKASFERLRRQPASMAAAALAGYAKDPLGALIAWSDAATTAPGVARRRLQRLGACDALIKVLNQRWRATPGRTGASRPRAPSPASAAPSIAPSTAASTAPAAGPSLAPSRRLP